MKASTYRISIFYSLFCAVLFLGLPFMGYAQPCTNVTQLPVATQVIPTTGAAMVIASSTTDFFQCTVVSGEQYLVYTATGTDEVSVWGTSNGTGPLGNGTSAAGVWPTTTGTSMWVDINKSGVCGGTASARNTTVELLPYNFTVPGGVHCIGQTIAVTGNALIQVNLVTFAGGVTAVPTAVTAVSFNVVIPAGATSGPITLQTNDGVFNITTGTPSTNSLIIETATGVSFVPTGGGIGDIVTISGTNLLGATGVAINGTAGTGVTVTNTQIVFTVAAGTTTGNVTFTDGCGNVINAGVFTVVALTQYYSNAGNLNLLTSWGTATNGTGANPPNFTANGQRFNIRNNAAPTIAAAWPVSGTGAGVIVGDGINPCNFTVPAAAAFTGNVLKVNANATLTLNNATVPTLASCLCDIASTVIFGMNASVTVPGITYGNLNIPGAAGNTYTFGGNSTIAGTFNISTTGTVRLNNAAVARTININNFIQSAGTVNPSSSGVTTVNITGNYTGSGGTMITAPAAIFYLNFNGGINQTFSNTTTITYDVVKISNNTTLTLSSGFQLNGITGYVLTLDAGSTLNAGTNQLSTTASPVTFDINGTLQTANTAGLNGSATTTLLNTNAPVFVLGTASTIEYNAALAQTVTARADYANVTITNNSIKTPAGAITVSGNLTINATATLAASTFTHNFNGNFINNGAFTGSTGTIIFGDNTPQSISGSTTTTFNNLTINNTSTGVTLSTPANVSGALTLTTGLLNTGAVNILTMQNGSTVLGAFSDASTSYVNGPMMYQTRANTVNVALTFPIGKSPDCRPVILTVNHKNSSLYNYQAESFNLPATFLAYTLPVTVDTVSGVHYWTIDRTDSAANAQPNLNLNGNQKIQIFFGTNDFVYQGTNLTIVKNTAGAPSTWFDIGGTCSFLTNNPAPTAGNVFSTSAPNTFTSFSTFTLGSKITGWNSLPIKLLTFTATPSGSKVDVAWTTENEVNNKYFTVERSSDGHTFTEIGTKPSSAPKGNSTSKLDYQTTDTKPLSGTSYYRLKQTDYNGKFEYFKMVPVNFTPGRAITFTVYPNPNQGQFTADFSGIENNHEVQILLNDEHGKLVYSNTFYAQESGNSVSIIPEQKISKGVYFCSLIVEGIKHTVKVVVN